MSSTSKVSTVMSRPGPGSGSCKCAVPDCKRRNELPGIRMLRFPSNIHEREVWASLIRRENWTPKFYSRICSWHFPTGNRKCGPTRFEWDSNPDRTLRLTKRIDRLYQKGNGKELTNPSTPAAAPQTESDQYSNETEEVTEATETMKNEIAGLKDELEKAKKELEAQSKSHTTQLTETTEKLRMENTRVLEQLRLAESNCWTLMQENGVLGTIIIRYSSLKLSDDRMTRLVRIKVQTFDSLCSIIKSRPIKYEYDWEVKCIPFEDQVLIFLLKIQFKLPFDFLSVIFMKNRSTLTNAFQTMYNCFQSCSDQDLFKGVPELDKIVATFREYVKNNKPRAKSESKTPIKKKK